MGNSNDALFPGRDTPSMRAGRSNASAASAPKPYNPNEDDAIEHTSSGSIRSGGSQDQSQYVVAPSIQVRSEFSTLTRTNEASQPLTCIVVVELPGKRQNVHVPGSVMPSSSSYMSRNRDTPSLHGQGSLHGHGGPSGVMSPPAGVMSPTGAMSPTGVMSPTGMMSPPRHMSPAPDYGYGRPPRLPSEMHSPSSSQSHSRANHLYPVQESSPYQLSPTNSHDALVTRSPPQPAPHIQHEGEDSPFNSITEDLRNRIMDWKGHPLEGLGPLQMYDLLAVRRDSIVREFFVYLFKEAIICVVEEKKRSLGRLLSSEPSGSGMGSGTSNNRGVLRLKGRIYIKHIKQVTDTSVNGELSLTIDMEDERLDSFILIFKERPSLETWKAHIQALVALYQQQGLHATQQAQQSQQSGALEEFGGSQKAMRMLSGSTGTTVSTADSVLQSSSRSTISSNTSLGSMSMRMDLQNHQHKLSPLEEDDELSRYGTPAPLVAPHLSSGPSNSLTPLQHPGLDLILVISLPPANATPSTAALKMRVIRTSLDFILAQLSTRDRLSLVTFEVGMGGKVRKTPFLCVGKPQSRARLNKFIEEIGRREEGFDDEFAVRTGQEDKTDVVTAVNHGTYL